MSSIPRQYRLIVLAAASGIIAPPFRFLPVAIMCAGFPAFLIYFLLSSIDFMAIVGNYIARGERPILMLVMIRMPGPIYWVDAVYIITFNIPIQNIY
jgi:hypothetical protein